MKTVTFYPYMKVFRAKQDFTHDNVHVTDPRVVKQVLAK
jgi:hypothetical protein